MRNKFFLFSIVILFFLNGNTSINAKDLSFGETEKLIFSLRWMGIIGGKSTIEIKKEPFPNSAENVYLLDAELRTVGFADMVFRIRDEFSSLVTFDLQQVLPVWWEVTLKEKNYKYEEKTEFSEMLKENPDLQSPLSALCLLRLRNWEVGGNITVPVLVRKKNLSYKSSSGFKRTLKHLWQDF